MNSVPDTGFEAQRRDERDSLLLLAQLKLAGAGAFEAVRVRNVSSGGLMAQTEGHYPVGAAVQVEIDGIGTVGGSVAWAEAGRIGVAFDHPIDKARARKPVKPGAAKAGDPLYRPLAADYRRPPLKPR